MRLDSVSSLELSDAELECVYGGDLGAGLGSGLGLGASESAAASERVHSFGVTCDINIFSLNLDLIPVLNIANSLNQICANSD